MEGLEVAAKSDQGAHSLDAQAQIFRTDVDHFLRNPRLAEENFGPSSIVVRCGDKEEIDTCRQIAGRSSHRHNPCGRG